MSEYIDRDVAIAIIEERQKELCPVGRYSRHYVYGTDRERFDAWQEIIDALGASKTADVEEVVRCKDCINYINGMCFRCGMGHEVSVDADDFCSRGVTE